MEFGLGLELGLDWARDEIYVCIHARSNLLDERADNPAVVSWMLSPLQVVHFPITMAVIVFFEYVTLMGVLQGDSLVITGCIS